MVFYQVVIGSKLALYLKLIGIKPIIAESTKPKLPHLCPVCGADGDMWCGNP